MILLGVVFAWSLLVVAGRTSPAVSNRWNVGLVAVVLAVMAALASGASSNTVYDRNLYRLHFEHLALVSSPGVLPHESTDPLFDYLLWGAARVLPATEVVLFTMVGVIMAAGVLWALSRLLPAWAVLGAFLTLIACGLFAAYTGVVIRQGVAIALILPALALAAQQRRTKTMLLLVVAAPLLHWTAVIPALAVVLVRFARPPLAALLWGWALLAVAFVLGAQQRLLGGLGSRIEDLDAYTSPAALAAYRGGVNRLDFLAVSVAILVAALTARRWVRDDPTYDALVSAYVMFNAAFLLFGFIAYSDRLASYSWFLGPVIGWYALARWAPGRPALAPVLALLSVLALGTMTGAWSSLAAVAV